MTEALIAQEAAVRLGSFVFVFAAIALLEVWVPRREAGVPRAARWPSNLGIVVLNTAVLRILVPTALVAFAHEMSTGDVGLFHYLAWPAWLAIVATVLLMDLFIYLQHILFHKVPVLWRLHRVHHADPHFDVTTGVRFHPFEIVLSLAIKFAIVAVLGPPAAGVLIFEILLNAGSLFSHGNFRLPPPVDRWLRLLVVTPDMHRVHHSERRYETDSNFGFCLPWWDRLFRTYRPQPEAGHRGMQIGIGVFGSVREQRLPRLLTQPFRNE